MLNTELRTHCSKRLVLLDPCRILNASCISIYIYINISIVPGGDLLNSVLFLFISAVYLY